MRVKSRRLVKVPPAVQEAIEGSMQKLAGLVCDAASREAEKHRAAQSFSPETIKDAPTRALFEAALGLQAHAVVGRPKVWVAQRRLRERLQPNVNQNGRWCNCEEKGPCEQTLEGWLSALSTLFFLQMRTHGTVTAIFEIYKAYALLHSSKLKMFVNV